MDCLCCPALANAQCRPDDSDDLRLQQQVYTMRQALALTGPQTLYRWLALLLVTAKPTPTRALAARTAVTRQRAASPPSP